VPPLIRQNLALLDPDRNPFFDHAGEVRPRLASDPQLYVRAAEEHRLKLEASLSSGTASFPAKDEVSAVVAALNSNVQLMENTLAALKEITDRGDELAARYADAP
jgi:hypothetical protein